MFHFENDETVGLVPVDTSPIHKIRVSVVPHAILPRIASRSTKKCLDCIFSSLVERDFKLLAQYELVLQLNCSTERAPGLLWAQSMQGPDPCSSSTASQPISECPHFECTLMVTVSMVWQRVQHESCMILDFFMLNSALGNPSWIDLLD